MKRRLILILLLSVVAAAILVWLYGVASDPASGRRRSSWDDIIADLRDEHENADESVADVLHRAVIGEQRLQVGEIRDQHGGRGSYGESRTKAIQRMQRVWMICSAALTRSRFCS